MNHHKQMIHCESLLVITRGYPRKKKYYESLLVITRGYPRLKKNKNVISESSQSLTVLSQAMKMVATAKFKKVWDPGKCWLNEF